MVYGLKAVDVTSALKGFVCHPGHWPCLQIWVGCCVVQPESFLLSGVVPCCPVRQQQEDARML